MPDDELGLELMRLHRQLRLEPDPRVRAGLRQLIDALLDRAQHQMTNAYAGVGKRRLKDLTPSKS